MSDATNQARPTPNPRNAAMQQIAQQAHAEIAHEFNSFNEDTGEIGGAAFEQKEEKPRQTAAIETDVEDHQEDTQQEEQQELPQELQTQQTARTIRIKVDGQDIEVTEDQVIDAGRRALQKDRAADRRLQEAAILRQQAQALYERAQQLSPGDAAQGNDQALSQDAQRQAQPDLHKLVKAEVYNTSAEQAATRFFGEFEDIAKDPYLAQMAARMEDERLAEAAATGKPLGDPMEAYRSHGKRIREWLQNKGVPAQSEQADKQERKRTITAVSGVNAKRPPVQEAKPLTVEQQIEQMRTARRQGRAIPH